MCNYQVSLFGIYTNMFLNQFASKRCTHLCTCCENAVLFSQQICSVCAFVCACVHIWCVNYVYVYTCMCVYMCMCVYVCMWTCACLILLHYWPWTNNGRCFLLRHMSVQWLSHMSPAYSCSTHRGSTHFRFN